MITTPSALPSALLAIVIFSALTGSGAGQDGDVVKLPLSPLGSRLPATAGEGRQASDKQQYGIVTIHERSLAFPVKVAESEDERLRVHSDVFDYYFLPLTVGVAGLDGSQVRSFLVEFSLPDRRVSDNDAWIVDVFPRVETSAGRLSADAEVGVSGNLKIEAAVPGAPIAQTGATIDGKATVNWTYNPVFQSFTAVFSEATAIWAFDKVGDTIKAGPIDVRLLIAVRKNGRVAEDEGLSLKSRIRAEFTGGLFSGRYASTEATIRVDL